MTNEEILEGCAEAAHEMNRAYCRSIGDLSQPHWAEAPEWQRASARLGVKVALAGASPRESHESWLAEKTRDGWKYGPVKDPEKKEHPSYLPFDELPDADRAKDELFLTTVRGMAKALGWKA